MDADAPLDYAIIQIAPSENRYEALVCHDNKIHALVTGTLDSLLPHLSEAKELHTKGCNADFRLQLPYTPERAAWFTKSTLSKFLHIVGSPDFMNVINTVKDEIAQLEEAKRFHLSLYDQVPVRSEEIDGCNSHGVAFTNKPEVELASSDASKNELLRAMDLRLVALRRELATAFNKATGGTSSSKEIADLAKFCEHFGATYLKNCMCTLLELNQNCETADPLMDGKSVVASASRNDNVNRRDGSLNVFKKMHSATQVKYNVSPAKVAQVERQSLSESDEESSDLCNDNNGTHVEERSIRTLIRSATPRRSASPMRRIQIGRSGSRRMQPLTIKSLNHFQARERVISSQGDGASAINSSDEAASDEHPGGKKPDNSIVRMSVQDKINLFESKQRKDHAADIQKRLLAGNIPAVNANKSVLRRWSAGMIRETGNQSQAEILCGGESVPTTIPSDVEDGEITKFEEVKAESDFVSTENHNSVGTAEDDVEEPEKLKTTASGPMEIHAEDYNNTRQEEGEVDSKLIVTEPEWSRKQEVELLNQMSMMKMMENCKPAAALKKSGAIMRSQHLPTEKRGGFYDNYKEKREEKLRGENAKKRANKAAQFRAMQQILDERKAEMASAKVKNIIKNKPVINKPQIPPKNQPSKPENPKKETSKPSSADRRKISSKTSTMPDTRKSWPSSSSSPRRTIGSSSPAKKPSGISSSAGITPTRRKLPQSTPSPTQSNIIKMEERYQLRQRNVKETTQGSNDRILKRANEKQQQPTGTKNGKTMTIKKAVVTPGEISSIVPVKSGFSNKKRTTRKSSVVPLESNHTVRKGSEVAIGISSVVNKTEERSSKPEDFPQRSCRNLIEAQANELVVNTSDLGSEHQEEGTCKFHDQNGTHVESDTQEVRNQLCVKVEKLDEDAGNSDDVLQNAGANSALQIQLEKESLISSKSWLEIEEHQDMPPNDDDTCQPAFPAITTGPAPALPDPPRVRHSLSQMLQEEESSEPDTNEWGNAENPPSMIYQKDGPKGLKRLLKFARKSKGDTSMTGWSSPSVASEGEDDSDESKAFSKKNADNLLRKATLHGKNYRNFKTSLDRNSEAHDLCSGTFGGQNFLHDFRESLNGAEAPTAKAARSFFSLSAFSRGNKATDRKLR